MLSGQAKLKVQMCGRRKLDKLLDTFQNFNLNIGVTQSKRYVTFYYIFYFSKIIYHSEEEGDLDTFVYIFRHPSHSSSFCLHPKLSKARVIVVGGE